jgi:hypothetical protein
MRELREVRVGMWMGRLLLRRSLLMSDGACYDL